MSEHARYQKGEEGAPMCWPDEIAPVTPRLSSVSQVRRTFVSMHATPDLLYCHAFHQKLQHATAFNPLPLPETTYTPTQPFSSRTNGKEDVTQ